MRPLLQPRIEMIESLAADRIDLTPWLLDVMGAYCGICERPLFERAYVWDALTGELLSMRRTGMPSNQLILLCLTCASVQQQRRDDPAALALPFTAQLSLPVGGGRAPLSWSAAGFAYLNDAVVGLDSPSARAITYFQLNGGPSDPRVTLRQRAAVVARTARQRAVADYAERPTTYRLRWIAHAMVNTGFVSTWLTEFFADPAASEVITVLVAESMEAVPGFFPSTDWSRVTPPDIFGTST